MLDALRQARVIENDYVKRWKADGGVVVGYSCSFAPPEIFEAAGVLPFRIRALGNSRTELADSRLSRFNCSFCRACLQLGLEGAYDFLDGLVETNGCDQLRGMFENWQYAHPVAFFHYLKGPHIETPEALEYYTGELRACALTTAAHFGRELSEPALWDAIHRQERIRVLQRQLNGMRAKENPALTGAEMLGLILLGSAMLATEYERLLTQVIAESETRTVPGFKARLVLGGSATDETEFVELIEDVGGLVVADALCFGARAFLPELDRAEADPWRALADLYLRRSLCPRMFDGFARRLEFIERLVTETRAHGVILVHNKFCDIHGIDNTLLRKKLREVGTPVLTLEKEYGGLADFGRLRTRVQAFLEHIGGRA